MIHSLFCFYIFPAPSKTPFISLKPKIPFSPEVTHTKPGNYPELFNIPKIGLKFCFVPLFGARASDVYFGILVFNTFFYEKYNSVMK